MAGLAAKARVYVNMMIEMAKPQLAEFWKYAKVELSPPLPSDFGKIAKTVEKTKKKAKAKGKGLGKVTVAEAWLNTLVTIEVITWFYMGEVIGKRHLVGYKV